MKVLISGFEKFAHHKENSSEVVVNHFKESSDLKKVILPVAFQDAFVKLETVINEFRPDAVLCFGLASKREVISLEKVAINLIDCDIPDNAGMIYRDETILPNAPAAYFSSIPLASLLNISKAHFPTEFSYSAGAYVCNFLMFRLLHAIQGQSIQGGFIHLPEMNSSNRTQILKAVESMIESLMEEKVP